MTRRRSALRGLDRVELGCLVALALFSVAVLAALAAKAISAGDRTLTGADGLLALDQMQYLTWIREASNHGLIGNPWDLAPGDRTFLHPLFLPTGALVALTGLPIPVVWLALFKPVAVGVLFAGALLLVRRFLPAGGPRHAGLVLALFAVAPASAFFGLTGVGPKQREYTFDFIAGEMFSAGYLWGYLPTAIAVGLMPLVLLGLERWRDTPAAERPAIAWWPALGAFAVCWLQPWQGATLGLILVAVEALRWRSRPGDRALLGLGAVTAALVLPALYYLLLSLFDPAWELAGEANRRGAVEVWQWPLWAVLLSLAPLALPALLALREGPDGPPRRWGDLAVRAWPFCAVAVYLLPFGTFPYHSFQALTLPLAVLAVQGVLLRFGRPPVAVVVALLFAMTVPGLVHRADIARNSIQDAGDPYFVFDDERRALDRLRDDPTPGGVLAPSYAALLVTAEAGRETWAGAYSWTPDWSERTQEANALFEGRLRGAAARDLVVRSRARFLFTDCRPGLVDVARDPSVRPLVQRTERFGCATVHVLRPRPEMAQAAGPPDS